MGFVLSITAIFVFGVVPLSCSVYVFGLDIGRIAARGIERAVRLAILVGGLITLGAFLPVALSAPLWVSAVWLCFAAATIKVVARNWRAWYILAFVPVNRWRYRHAIFLMDFYLWCGYAVSFQRGRGYENASDITRIAPLVMTARVVRGAKSPRMLPTRVVRRFAVSARAQQWYLIEQMTQFFRIVLALDTNITRQHFDVTRSRLVVTVSDTGGCTVEVC